MPFHLFNYYFKYNNKVLHFMPFYTSKLVNVDMDKIKCSIGNLCLLFFSTQVLGKKNKKGSAHALLILGVFYKEITLFSSI